MNHTLRISLITLALIPLAASAQNEGKSQTSESLYREAQNRFEQKAYAAAIPLLNNLLQRQQISHERQTEAAYMLAFTSYELQDDNAENQLRDYLDHFPETPHRNRVTALLASTNFFEENYEGALAYFAQTDLGTLADDERDDMTYRQAMAFMKTGNLQQAAIWFKTLQELSPRYRDDCTYALAYIHYTRGQLDEALEEFQSLQNVEEYALLTPYYIAEIYLLKGNDAEAERVADAYLQNFPQQAEAAEMLRVKGTVDYNRGNYLDAMNNLAEYTANQTDNQPRRDALYRLGLSRYQCGVYTPVPETLAPVTDGTDELAQNAWLHTGLAYLQLADKNRARMAFGQAASSNANLAIKEQAAYNYALCLHETEYSAFGEGVTAFETFLNEFPNSPYADQASQYLVEVYMNTRSYEAALQSINRIHTPSTTILEAKQNVLLQLGIQAYANTLWDRAIDYLNQSIAIGAPGAALQEAYYWRGETYYRQGKLNQADSDLTTYLRLNPNTSTDMFPLAYYTLGYIDFHAQSFQAALTHFRAYIQSQRGDRPDVLADAYCRMADCYLHEREFDQATVYYKRAEDLNAGSGDYACYQRALVAGLQKDYSTKVLLTDRLINNYPQSPYTVNALYEKGRAYVQTGQNDRAIATYQELMERFPESAVCRKAAAETGLLYYQQEDYDKAIAAYRHVLTQYPGSEEARAAMVDIKSIYVETNRVDEMSALLASLPGNLSFEPSEQDSLTFIAAEKVYMRGELAQARQSLDRYIQTFPQGAYRIEAQHYLCLIAQQQGDRDELLTQTTALLEWPDSPFAEEALSLRAGIFFERGQYAEAATDYSQLRAKASSEARRLEGETGMMRCAVLLSDHVETIRTASDLLEETKLTSDLRTEALYARAKAYEAENAPQKALSDYRLLAEDTRTTQGAEAKYLVAQSLHDQGKEAEAEQEVMDFIEQSTPHAYWLARSFILLADVYIAQGKTLEAKEYLLSLRQNYTADDDIDTLISQRLEVIKTVNNE